MDDIKKCKGAVSEDDIKRHTKEVNNKPGHVRRLINSCFKMEALTEKKIEKVNQLAKSKENEINSIID